MPASRSRMRLYRLPALLTALALLLGVGAAAVLGVRSFQASSDRIGHSYRVLNQIESVRVAVRAAQADARGHRISGHAEFRSEYLQSLDASARATDALIALTADNPAQQQRALRLREQTEEHLAELERVAGTQLAEGMEAARRATRAGLSLRQMQRIDATSQEMLAHEHRLLDERSRYNRRNAALVTGFVVLGILMSLLLLALLMGNLARENRRSRLLEREARRAVHKLQASLLQRDRLSEQRRRLSEYTGMLQSCQTRDEIMALTSAVVEDLLPDCSGRCYLLRASHDILEATASFGAPPLVASSEQMLPDQCWALRRGRPHLTADGRSGARCAHLDRADAAGEAATLCIPLAAQGALLGLLHVSGPARADADADEAETTAAVAAVAEQLAMALANLQLRESLRMQSLRDGLTGLFNRRYLEESLARELRRCERRQLPLSVLMLDIDHFKRFNDEHGHAAGDAVLAHVASTLQSLVRAEDIACRYGGEEFTVLMPEADAASALDRAEQIRSTIGSAALLHLSGTLGPVTTSIGVATFPADGSTPASLLAAADAMLYRAKAAGRNRVLHASAAG